MRAGPKPLGFALEAHLARLDRLGDLGPDLEGITPEWVTERDSIIAKVRAVIGAIRRAVRQAVAARPPTPPVARRHLLEDRLASSEVRRYRRRLDPGPPPLLRLARSVARHAPPVIGPGEVLTV